MLGRSNGRAADTAATAAAEPKKSRFSAAEGLVEDSLNLFHNAPVKLGGIDRKQGLKLAGMYRSFWRLKVHTALSRSKVPMPEEDRPVEAVDDGPPADMAAAAAAAGGDDAPDPHALPCAPADEGKRRSRSPSCSCEELCAL